MAVTIKDVALAAGVSPATLCRALSTPDRVRPAIRERVRRAVDDLDYPPGIRAQQSVDAMGVNYATMLLLVLLVVAMRLLNPTQLAAR